MMQPEHPSLSAYSCTTEKLHLRAIKQAAADLCAYFNGCVFHVAAESVSQTTYIISHYLLLFPLCVLLFDQILTICALEI